MFSDRIKRLIITITIGVIILIILHYTHILRPVENAVAFLLTPVQKSIFSVSTSINRRYSKKITFDELLEENKELEQKVSQLLVEQVSLEELRRENKELKTLLTVQEEQDYRLQVASIIGKTVDGLQNTFLLNRGRHHGVEIGYPVIAYDGILVGKVIKVHERTSIIRLVTDNESKIAASILNQDKTIGLVEGQHNINMIMKLIPQNEVIYEENTVITSGIEEFIPRGLIVGMVDTQVTQGGDLFKSAVIRPVIAYDRITLVGIIIPQ